VICIRILPKVIKNLIISPDLKTSLMVDAKPEPEVILKSPRTAQHWLIPLVVPK
jgi:hypothetical protein